MGADRRPGCWCCERDGRRPSAPATPPPGPRQGKFKPPDSALRVAAWSSNILKLVELRDSSPNAMARVAAIKTLEAIEDETPRTAGCQTMPGLQIVIVEQPRPLASPQPVIEAKALLGRA
jgi:hypothetical protein